MTSHTSSRRLKSLTALCAALAIGACTSPHSLLKSHAGAGDPTTQALRSRVKTIVVIYAENRAFDNLYGNFPGAGGLRDVVDAAGHPLPAYVPQRDRDGSVLAKLPQTWGGVTAAGYQPVVTQAQSGGLPNAPFSIEHAFTGQSTVTLSTQVVTRDLYHRFYEHQMQIDGGKNDGYAAWSDSGGLTMGHYDYSRSALYALARKYVLADHFFQGAFGGSFLNHQYLICACAPEYPNADTAAAKPSLTVLDSDAGHLLPRLTVAKGSPASALDGPPKFVKSGNIAPADYFGDGKFHAVNTMQPAYQPSGNAPARGGAPDYADPNNSTTLPPQSGPTIGDRLSAKNVAWTWYAGSWDAAIADGRQPAARMRKVIYAPTTPAGSPDFQPHHQPFNYYSRFDPEAHADQRAEHLKDYDGLIADIGAGRLPPVVFYKPQGNLNQHPGYASVADGREASGRPAVEGHGDRHHLRRIRRGLGPCRAAEGRSARAGCSHPGDRDFALCKNGHGRPHAIRHGLHPAFVHPPLRPCDPARHRGARPRPRGTRRGPHGRSDQRAGLDAAPMTGERQGAAGRVAHVVRSADA